VTRTLLCGWCRWAETDEIPRPVAPAARLRSGLLARDLANLSAVEWIDHFVKQNYEGDWSVLPLRCSAGARPSG